MKKMKNTTKEWNGQIPEENHIAIHYCKKVHDIETTAKRIREYGDRRASEERSRIENNLKKLFGI